MIWLSIFNSRRYETALLVEISLTRRAAFFIAIIISAAQIKDLGWRSTSLHGFFPLFLAAAESLIYWTYRPSNIGAEDLEIWTARLAASCQEERDLSHLTKLALKDGRS